jgi:hypothetical protein
MKYKTKEGDDSGEKDSTSMEVEVELDDDRRTSTKRKAVLVDQAFERMFGYQWGTSFHLDESEMSSTARQIVQIFGFARAARVLGSRGSGKRQKVAPTQRTIDYEDIQLPKPNPTALSESKVFAGKVVQTTRKQAEQQKTKPSSGGSKLDNVLAQLVGPAKMSTVQKTSNDWDQFKETDKQLQDELEKKAQGKDAFLVRQDFNNRVDQRKFELEREQRERERAKRATNG